MSDEHARYLERAAAFGDTDAAGSAARHAERRLDGPLAQLRRFIGRPVYVEGARMNYCGILQCVLGDAQGQPLALLFDPLWRVGDWTAAGSQRDYTTRLPTEPDLPQWLPWGAVDGFGLAPWPLPE